MTRSTTPSRSRDPRTGDRPPGPAALGERLAEVTVQDRARIERRLERCRRMRDPSAREAELARLDRAVREAREALGARRLTVPALSYPPELPVSARREDLLEAIRSHQVVVVAGETGSGKTTQLPKLCLEAGLGVRGRIGHTQPRRIAARAVADRIASELGTRLGDVVGYKVRFTDRVGDGTLVKLMTDGILLAEIGQDRDLLQYDTLIVDEAHERSLNVDFLLGYLARLLPRRPDLKVIITSATIDPQRFSDHFGGAPVVEVSGRTYPVEIRYRPLDDAAGDDDPAREPRDRVEGICEAVLELAYEGEGDVLVFLSGEREIRDAAEALTRLELRGTEILPLYGRLSAAEQHRVFTAHRGRRVVLATNVAETSLTVPGIRYVVDPGTARISRYSHRTKVQRLPIEAISQASARQRAGRCGRLSDGVCIRLYSQEDFESRQEFTDPEILRTHLASVILQMTALGLGEVTDFPFIDPPDGRQVRDGVDLLTELGALEPDRRGHGRRLTPIGRELARLPVDPRLARMIVQAGREGCVHEVMVIAAALSIQDVRERPSDRQQAADEAHRRFADPTSDFLTYLNLWNHLEERQRELSGSAFRRLCHREFLHYLRIREWQDLVAQLRRLSRPVALPAGDAADGRRGGQRSLPGPADRGPERAGRPDRGRGGSRVLAARERRRRRELEVTGSVPPEAIHTALLSGLLSHVGLRDAERRDYQGARGARFAVWPGSALFKKPPAWVMAAELVETSRLWGRVLARVEPEWIEAAAAHLVKRQYGEPHWERRRGEVVAVERVTLYGVPVVVGRRVGYGRIDPAAARELFVRHALVEGDWETHHRFFAQNRRTVQEIERLEHRVRRRDLIVDDEELFDFYDRRVPADVVSARHFDAWWKRARHGTPDLLTVTPEVLLREGAGRVREEDFPQVWACGELELPVSYRFEPGSQDDGVTVQVPVAALDRLDAAEFTWQVPGLREELATALLRSLPKHFRRSFVPAPDHAAAALRALTPGEGSLPEALAAQLSRMAGVRIGADSWQWDRVPDHLRVTFRVVDDGGQVLATGKDLPGLRCRMRPRLRRALSRATAGIERPGLRAWTIGDLPAEVERRTGAGHVLRGYPALVDEGDSVAVRVLDSRTAQEAAMRAGTRRLLLLGVPSPVKRVAGSLPTASKLVLSDNPHGGIAPLLADCLDCAADAVIDRAGGPVRTRRGFEELLLAGSQRLPATFGEVLAAVEQVLAAWQEVRRGLRSTASPTLLPSLVDLREQSDQLVHPGFVTATGIRRLPDLVRYLRAAQRRLEVLPERAARDRDLLGRVLAVSDRYEEFLERLPPQVPRSGEVAEIRWMLQELRVGLFAQMIRTAYPVSEKRILKELDRLGG